MLGKSSRPGHDGSIRALCLAQLVQNAFIWLLCMLLEGWKDLMKNNHCSEIPHIKRIQAEYFWCHERSRREVLWPSWWKQLEGSCCASHISRHEYGIHPIREGWAVLNKQTPLSSLTSQDFREKNICPHTK
jgi:hypothetical protein